jgi:hypothetical protein
MYETQYPTDFQRSNDCTVEYSSVQRGTFIFSCPAQSGAPASPCSVGTVTPIDPNCSVYYFEVELRSTAGDQRPLDVVIGLARDSLLPPGKLPGEEPTSIGFFAGQRMVYARDGANGMPYGPARLQTVGDVAGCLVNFPDSSISFTVNGELLPVAGRLAAEGQHGLYPHVGWQRSKPGCSLRVSLLCAMPAGFSHGSSNEAPSFRFDLARYLKHFSVRALSRPPVSAESVADNGATDSLLDSVVSLALRRHFAARGLPAVLTAFEKERDQLRPNTGRTSTSNSGDRQKNLRVKESREHCIAALTSNIRRMIVQEGDYSSAVHRLAAARDLDALQRGRRLANDDDDDEDESFGMFDTRPDLLYCLRACHHIERILSSLTPRSPPDIQLEMLAPMVDEMYEELVIDMTALGGATGSRAQGECPSEQLRRLFVRDVAMAGCCMTLSQTLPEKNANLGNGLLTSPIEVRGFFREASWRAIVHAMEDLLADDCSDQREVEVDLVEPLCSPQSATLRTLWRDAHASAAVQPVLGAVSSTIRSLLTAKLGRVTDESRLDGGSEVVMPCPTNDKGTPASSEVLVYERSRARAALERVIFVASTDQKLQTLDERQMLGWPSASMYLRRAFSTLFGY